MLSVIQISIILAWIKSVGCIIFLIYKNNADLNKILVQNYQNSVSIGLTQNKAQM